MLNQSALDGMKMSGNDSRIWIDAELVNLNDIQSIEKKVFYKQWSVNWRRHAKRLDLVGSSTGWRVDVPEPCTHPARHNFCLPILTHCLIDFSLEYLGVRQSLGNWPARSLARSALPQFGLESCRRFCRLFSKPLEWPMHTT